MRLEAKNIGFHYRNGPWLFRDVNLTVSPGEVVGIQGPSGQGKTTLCRIIAGFEQPVEGTVHYNGAPVSTRGYHPVQLVLQHPEKAVNPRWKMEKVLREGWDPDQHVMKAFGIEQEWMTRWPSELSGGELQRFCVVRALGPDTRFLIADEMTTMLDAITQAQIWQAVLEIAKEREMGMIVVSHEEKLMDRLCDRVISLHK